MRLRRVMTAAVKSGSGKTILTCGLLEALKRRGTDVRAYKCGPDYIDPMFHRSVIDVPGGNIDTFFSSDDEIRGMLCRCGAEAAVIEGVMGIYDGIAGQGVRGSCYGAASVTATPVLLIIDVKGMGHTMLSVIKGILSDDSEKLIRGIILNRISPAYLETVRPQLEKLLSDVSAERGTELRLLGGIPASGKIRLDSRHLGLNMPDEADDLKEQLKAAADLIEENLDMNAVLGIMEDADELPDPECAEETPTCGEPELTIAVARDEAFCFYYEENLRVLKEAGIRITEFSPLQDAAIPEEADGLLLGGGYPELYAKELCANESMRSSVREAVGSGMPCLAECGGFMYLMESIEDMQGEKHEMTGAVSGGSFYTGRLGRFGYITLKERKQHSAADTLITGLELRGHEFHYCDSDNNGSDALAEKPGGGASWECMHADRKHLWGYPHLWYPSCPELIRRFRKAMEEYGKTKRNG